MEIGFVCCHIDLLGWPRWIMLSYTRNTHQDYLMVLVFGQVEMHGLTRRVELNGVQGTVVDWGCDGKSSRLPFVISITAVSFQMC